MYIENLTNNLQTLSKRDPVLAQRIVDHVNRNGLVSPTKDPQGRWNIKVSEAGHPDQWFYPEGIEDPSKGIRDSVHSLKDPQIIVMLGLGLGYHLKALLQYSHPVTAYRIVVEPSLDFFAAFLSLPESKEIISRDDILWMVDVPDAQVELTLRSWLNRPRFTISLQSGILLEWGYPADWAAFKKRWAAFQEVVNEQLHINTIDSYYGFMNFCDNWPRVGRTPLLQEFKGVFEGKPAIIVGSGPSLTHCLDFLKEIQDRAVIFAAGSSFPLLQKKGIRCFLAGCLERIPTMRDVFVDTDTKDAYLVTTPVVHRDALDSFKGRVLYLQRKHHFLPVVFSDLEFDDVNISGVSHVAFQALVAMGCSSIYLVGQDLAFDPHTGQTHSDDYLYSISYDDLMNITRKTRRVLSNRDDGQEVETWEDWYGFAREFTQLIYSYGVPCVNVIPQEYGIRIDGAQRMDPLAALKILKDGKSFDAKGILDRRYGEFEEGRRSEYLERMASFPERALPSLQKIKDVATGILKEIYSFMAAHPPERGESVETFRAFFSRLEEVIKNQVSDPFFKHLVFPVAAARFYRCMLQSSQLNKADDHGPGVLAEKCSVLLSWFSEVAVRVEMMEKKIMNFES